MSVYCPVKCFPGQAMLCTVVVIVVRCCFKFTMFHHL